MATRRPRSRATAKSGGRKRSKGPAGFASSLEVPGGAAAERVCVGAITGAHGIAGAVRIKSFTEDPVDVAAYGPVTDEAGDRILELDVTGLSAGAVLARIDGVDDRTAAEALKGTRLYVPREKLPPPEDEEFYHADLLGLDAVLLDGAVFGVVAAVHQLGAGDALEISRGSDERPVIVPFTHEAVPEVDIRGGRVVVDPPSGLEDDADTGEDAE